ncbi:FAD-binding oxidoreductase [Ktedonosporobacter rubrisoli]|uniref:FAD-binding oxidoreductase n=1 Tax=Ktedonosporobacter rubrisoli TaxID=2509675 RepID=A0A4P6JQ29_KTERU|nr:FAD-binding oxidoreductase [Ktedonosporobacter rubrisoli]QBD77384.1 FAD-binding oxidoreductase [Ktedonosporobacter rubrisoli]
MSVEQAGQAIIFEPTDLQALRTRLRGKALVPGDEGYNKARQTWDTETFQQYPALVVLPYCTDDVQQAVKFAQKYGLPIGVQGGGHGHPYPVNGAILVNFAYMSKIQIDAQKASARVEPGVRSGDVVREAQSYGLAPLTGFATTVGIVGYMLGGGVGWLTRQYGPGAVSIRSAELVTAEGQVLRVSEKSYPDLLWGLRGGGGNFGIVTELELALYPVENIFGGQIVYPIAQGREVLNAYAQWIKNLPDELTSALRIVHFPLAPALPPTLRGASVIQVMACYNGDQSEGEALLRPMRRTSASLLDTFAQIPYAQIASISNDPVESPPYFLTGETRALRDLVPSDIETLLNATGNPAAGLMAEIRQFGGAFARQEEDSMSFSFRQALFSLTVMAGAPSCDLLGERKRAIAALMQKLTPMMTDEALINLKGNASEELTRAAYPLAIYQRLAALKQQYDPQNVFRFNHNIPPCRNKAWMQAADF